MSVEEARRAIVGAFSNYLRANCRRILSIARLTGQKYVKISFHGLYRHYEPTENFPRFTNAFELLKNKGEISELLRVKNLKVVEEDEEMHILIPLEVLEDLCLRVDKDDDLE